MSGRAQLAACAVVVCAMAFVGCGVTPSRAAATAPSPASAPAWNEYALPEQGLFAAFPKEPHEIASTGDAERVGQVGFEVVSDALELACVRTLLDANRPEDDVVLDNLHNVLFDSGASTTPFSERGFRGRLVEGKSKRDKHPQNARVVVVGNSLLVALVTHKKPGFGAIDTKRFLESCRFEIPWRLYPWPLAGVVVSMPSYAIEVDEKTMKLPEGMIGRSFFLGGEQDLVFMLATNPLEREDQSVSDDQILDGAVEGIAGDGNTRIISRSPVEFRGARGTDLLFQSEGSHHRWRVLVTPTRLYQIGVSAKDKPTLLLPEARKFIESLRWNEDE